AAPEAALRGLAVRIARQRDCRRVPIRRRGPDVVDPAVVVREPHVRTVGCPLVARRVLDVDEIVDRQLRPRSLRRQGGGRAQGQDEGELGSTHGDTNLLLLVAAAYRPVSERLKTFAW